MSPGYPILQRQDLQHDSSIKHLAPIAAASLHCLFRTVSNVKSLREAFLRFGFTKDDTVRIHDRVRIYQQVSNDMKRKLKELLYTLELERRLEKNEILEIYLNIVEFGPNIYGIKEAADVYFVKKLAFCPWKWFLRTSRRRSIRLKINYIHFNPDSFINNLLY